MLTNSPSMAVSDVAPLLSEVKVLLETIHGILLRQGKHVSSPTVVTAATSEKRPSPMLGGLAPYVMRRVDSYIDANLHANLRVEDLAAVAKLSDAHFIRAFSVCFGMSPHRYIIRRRIARAQDLMLSTRDPLSQIAVDCGLADQSHLTRLFLKLEGETPAAWRRARATRHDVESVTSVSVGSYPILER